jgi:hypothetical protein
MCSLSLIYAPCSQRSPRLSLDKLSSLAHCYAYRKGRAPQIQIVDG